MPADPSASLTLTIPVYNGAAFLDGTLSTARAWLATRNTVAELLVVDDCSTDATAEVIRAFAARTENTDAVTFRHVRNERNRGKGFSLRRAFLLANGDHVVFTDADLTYGMHDVATIVGALAGGADVAYGSRMHPDSRYVIAPTFLPKLYTRHAMGRVFNHLARMAVVPGIRDTQAGLKGFRREAARAIASRCRLDRFSFDVEMFFVARRLGLRIDECPVEFLYRKEPSTVRFATDSLRMLRDMARIRCRGVRGVYDRPDPALVRELTGAASDPSIEPAPVATRPAAEQRRLG
ncbi:MAG: glycosyltransferase [Planctomycetes bacterium]|nr:glycosyltransferase [Planctomycetota bacterium]